MDVSTVDTQDEYPLENTRNVRLLSIKRTPHTKSMGTLDYKTEAVRPLLDRA